jgi:hypothetical protein
MSVAELRRRLSGMTVSLDGETVTEEGVVVLFSIRGTQMAKIWNRFPAQAQGKEKKNKQERKRKITKCILQELLWLLGFEERPRFTLICLTN